MEMLIIKKRLKCSHCVRTMHKRIQLLKITAAMQIFFFSRNSIPTGNILRQEERKPQRKKPMQNSQWKPVSSVAWRHYAHYKLKLYSEPKASWKTNSGKHPDMTNPEITAWKLLFFFKNRHLSTWTVCVQSSICPLKLSYSSCNAD